MDRRAFLRKFQNIIIVSAAAVCGFESSALPVTHEISKEKPKRKKDPTEILKEVYKEVIEFGKKENEDFIKREFLMDLDGDARNTEEHVVVLIYSVRGREKMIVQVTYFKAEGYRPIIKYARDTKLVSCFINGDKIEIGKCDYNKKKLKSLLRDILDGIRYKKKLLKLIDRKK